MRATPPILAAFVVLVFSLSVIWSTTPSLALTQLTFILFSLLVTIIISQTSSSTLRSLALPAYIIAILSLIFTYILGQVTRGSVRWIEIGPFHLQTSETAKSLIILSFAYFLTQPILRPWRWLFTRILLLLPIALLVLLQPDLGSTIIISFIWFGMMLVSNLPRRYLLALTFTGLIALPLGYQLLEPYQQRRLTSFVNPYADPSGSGYNVIQSQIAIGSGRIIGKGVRQGTQSHLRFLPERHTDFAFASFAEEFGLVGTTILLVCLTLILVWLTKQIDNPDFFASLIATGAFWQFFSQTIVNVGMNLGLMPVTGITLPLFSYGGSSLLSFAITFGLVIATSKKTG